MTMTCNFCGAKIETGSVAEMLAWDASHKDACPKQPTA